MKFTLEIELGNDAMQTPDDVHAALLISLPGITPARVNTPVLNQQVAPTIIKALGFDPNQLEAVKKEQIAVLPFLFNNN